MGLYEVPLSMSLLGFRMVTMLANFHRCGIKLVLEAVFNMPVRNASPREPMCFRCRMFNLSGPWEFLFLLCFIASWTRVVVRVMLCPCIFLCFSVNVSVCLVYCVFDCISVFSTISRQGNQDFSMCKSVSYHLIALYYVPRLHYCILYLLYRIK